MSELTGDEASVAVAALEQAVATVLGQMLFEFARLDMALGLCLAWSDHGRQIDARTSLISNYGFHKRLDYLRTLVFEAFPAESKKHTEYCEWCTRAHKVRLVRNKLVHGRWGIDPYRQHAINIVGLPTSSDQAETRYSIEELEATLAEMKFLGAWLSALRRQSPL